MKNNKVEFKDLDVWLKVSVVWGLISLVFFIIAFLVEFIYALI